MFISLKLERDCCGRQNGANKAYFYECLELYRPLRTNLCSKPDPFRLTFPMTRSKALSIVTLWHSFTMNSIPKCIIRIISPFFPFVPQCLLAVQQNQPEGLTIRSIIPTRNKEAALRETGLHVRTTGMLGQPATSTNIWSHRIMFDFLAQGPQKYHGDIAENQRSTLLTYGPSPESNQGQTVLRGECFSN